MLKKLVTVIAAPIGQMYFKPLAPVLRAGSHAVLTMVAAHADEAFAHLVALWRRHRLPTRTVATTCRLYTNLHGIYDTRH